MKFLKNLFKERTPEQKLVNVLKSMRVQLGIATAQNAVKVHNEKVQIEIRNIRDSISRIVAELEK